MYSTLLGSTLRSSSCSPPDSCMRIRHTPRHAPSNGHARSTGNLLPRSQSDASIAVLHSVILLSPRVAKVTHVFQSESSLGSCTSAWTIGSRAAFVSALAAVGAAIAHTDSDTAAIADATLATQLLRARLSAADAMEGVTHCCCSHGLRRDADPWPRTPFVEGRNRCVLAPVLVGPGTTIIPLAVKKEVDSWIVQYTQHNNTAIAVFIALVPAVVAQCCVE